MTKLACVSDHTVSAVREANSQIANKTERIEANAQIAHKTERIGASAEIAHISPTDRLEASGRRARGRKPQSSPRYAVAQALQRVKSISAAL